MNAIGRSILAAALAVILGGCAQLGAVRYRVSLEVSDQAQPPTSQTKIAPAVARDARRSGAAVN